MVEETKTKNFAFKIKIYSANLKELNEVLNNILLDQKKTKYIRLKVKNKKITLRKNPHGRGYAVFVKKHYQFHKILLFFENLKALKDALKHVKLPGIFVENILC